ncbi:MAG: hypothetical protein ACJA0I_002075 [Gammaproteobacteria bacterium]
MTRHEGNPRNENTFTLSIGSRFFVQESHWF